MAVTPPAPKAPSAAAKFAAVVRNAVAFARSAQGKRDFALFVAAVGGGIDAFHRIFG